MQPPASPKSRRLLSAVFITIAILAPILAFGYIHASDRLKSDAGRKTFAIVVKDRRLISGPSNIKVNKGDSVRVNLTAEGEEASLKLDGYGINTESDPTDDTPGGFEFVAEKSGVFAFWSRGDIEANGTEPDADIKLGTITVK